jgi:DNA polymerase III sliding clamp (beta) subunit (PCNA family)
MLADLKFVQGAVAKKDPVPVLTHFSIRGGRVKGYNGLVTLCSPIPLSLDCQPKADAFTKAIGICEETVALSLTKAGRLTVASGRFKSHIDCSPDAFPEIEPDGQRIPIEPGLRHAFKVLQPLIAEDDSRKWARGILLREGSAYATNNVAIGQFWTAIQLPFDMNVPAEAVKEVVRVKEDPIAIQATETSITFHYETGRWIRSQLLSTAWPNLAPVLDRPCNPEPLTVGFFEALGSIVHFAEKNRKVFFNPNGVHTHEGEEGASVALEEWKGWRGIYNIDQLRVLDGLVSMVDWSLYPAPALFFGEERFRGAIVGMKP